MSKHRNFRFTWNNYPQDVSVSNFPDHVYLIYGKEIAPSTGTPHLQGHITFKNPRTLSGVIKIMKGCHVLVSDFPTSSAEYCKKDANFVESGIRPKTQKEKGQLGAAVYEAAFEAAKRGDMDSIPASLRLRYYRTLKEIAKDHMTEPADTNGTTGIWLWGEAGVGKSRKARADYPGAYKKNTNKWWDGYQNQKYVIIDDVDESHACLAHHFKIWADRYSFQAETKGGAMSIRPEKIIITSQYQPFDIWGDIKTRQAIARRYEIVEIKSQE